MRPPTPESKMPMPCASPAAAPHRAASARAERLLSRRRRPEDASATRPASPCRDRAAHRAAPPRSSARTRRYIATRSGWKSRHLPSALGTCSPARSRVPGKRARTRVRSPGENRSAPMLTTRAGRPARRRRPRRRDRDSPPPSRRARSADRSAPRPCSPPRHPPGRREPRRDGAVPCSAKAIAAGGASDHETTTRSCGSSASSSSTRRSWS